MATYTRIIEQLCPVSTGTLYTVPANTETQVTSLQICNQGGAATFSVWIIPSGGSLDTSRYLAKDAPIAANDFGAEVAGWTLPTGAVVGVGSSSGNVSFALFGLEKTS